METGVLTAMYVGGTAVWKRLHAAIDDGRREQHHALGRVRRWPGCEPQSRIEDCIAEYALWVAGCKVPPDVTETSEDS
eukprot:3938920-Rhodomonas_salina.2